MNDASRPTDRTQPAEESSLAAKAWVFAHKVLGPLVVASILWLAADRNNAWNRIHDIESVFSRHELEGQNRHTVIDIDIKRLYETLEKLSDDIAELHNTQQRILIEIAKLPPDKWEQKILENERDIIELKGANH